MSYLKNKTIEKPQTNPTKKPLLKQRKYSSSLRATHTISRQEICSTRTPYTAVPINSFPLLTSTCVSQANPRTANIYIYSRISLVNFQTGDGDNTNIHCTEAKCSLNSVVFALRKSVQSTAKYLFTKTRPHRKQTRAKETRFLFLFRIRNDPKSCQQQFSVAIFKLI